MARHDGPDIAAGVEGGLAGGVRRDERIDHRLLPDRRLAQAGDPADGGLDGAQRDLTGRTIGSDATIAPPARMKAVP